MFKIFFFKKKKRKYNFTQYKNFSWKRFVRIDHAADITKKMMAHDNER